ncbi:hypothetical protein HPB48_007020 [Haemaphysalis longicornis]|uniref:RRM domain-containing protein n=1 Tax=Haemaphysalis longicornis TaxID=44386 RepID=A0A9J6FDG6_HAELO|nr:hypothetical protein HPB48_007020 [Haemaphysalis longicornis]
MTRVYVGHLSYRVRERDLERFFRGFGKIREVLLKNGFGFVEFDDYRDADDAVYELNGRELDGERVVVELAHGTARRAPPPRSSWLDSGTNRYGPPTRTDYRVIIENLSSRISWQDLKDRMRQVGDVTYADAHRHRRNEGVVEFASYSDMKRAIEKLDNTELNGRRIRVIEEKPIRGVKFRTLHAFGARKRSMKLVCMAKKKVAQSIANEGVRASNDVSPALSVQDFDAASVSGVSSASTSATAASVSGLASTSTSGNVSRTVHLETHFLTCEEVEAANRRCAAVQNELGAMPATQRKLQATEAYPVPAIVTGEGLLEKYESVGLITPGHLALQRAAEKDALRMNKASKRKQEMEKQQRRKTVRQDPSRYAAGSF